MNLNNSVCPRFMGLVVAMAVSAISIAAYAEQKELIPRPRDKLALKYMEDGYRFYEAGEFEKAIEAYKKAQLRESSTVVHYNLGQCYRRLKKYEQAIFHYERVQEDSRVAQVVQGYVRQFIKEMREEMEAAAASKPPRGPVQAIKPTIRSHPSDPSRHTEPWYADKVGWALSSGGLTVGAVGVGLLFSASAIRSDSERELNMTRRQELRAQADSRRTWGTLLTVAGSIALTVGVVKLVRTRKKKARDSGARIRVAFGVRWLGVRGRF